MLQLIYISTARAPMIGDDLLRSILDASRRNNEAAGITGLLLAGGRRFLQALEGPEEAVLGTYARITADPRHFALVELSRVPIATPQFGAWAMAYKDGGDPRGGAQLREAVRALTAGLSDADTSALFTGFAELHSKAA